MTLENLYECSISFTAVIGLAAGLIFWLLYRE